MGKVRVRNYDQWKVRVRNYNQWKVRVRNYDQWKVRVRNSGKLCEKAVLGLRFRTSENLG